MEIRLRERFRRFANGLYSSNKVSFIEQSIANVALCNPFSVFSNANVAFSPNAISNVKYNMYNNWFSNIDESFKENDIFKELIDVRNGVKWVHAKYDVYCTQIMCSLM